MELDNIKKTFDKLADTLASYNEEDTVKIYPDIDGAICPSISAVLPFHEKALSEEMEKSCIHAIWVEDGSSIKRYHLSNKNLLVDMCTCTARFKKTDLKAAHNTLKRAIETIKKVDHR